jgi:hypothetical protein
MIADESPTIAAHIQQYDARPRWRRALACTRVLPHALWPYATVAVHLHRVQHAATPRTLPDVLQRLTPSIPHTTWHGLGPPLALGGCLTVAYRLTTRGHSGRCLPRALLLFGLVQRTEHAPVHFCLGAQRNRPHEHLAHAWVEVGGTALAEPVDPRTTHRPLYRYPSTA